MALGELDGQLIARSLCLRRQTLHGETAYTKQFTQCHGQTWHRSVQVISKTRSWQPHYAPPLGNIGTEMPAGEGLHRRWLSDLLIVLHPQVLLGTCILQACKAPQPEVRANVVETRVPCPSAGHTAATNAMTSYHAAAGLIPWSRTPATFVCRRQLPQCASGRLAQG